MSCDNPTCEPCEPPARTNAEKDEIVESGVLAFALDEHPDHLTIPAFSLAMNGRRNEEFPRRDAVERAIAQLVGAGLFVIAGGLVVPTRPALYFERLWRHL